jgi:16S rRNA (guanine966-N2)-methyltransferase
LFNWLQGQTEGRRCLDLFAGSGALGFEALSRGAESVEFVERDPVIAAALRANVQKLDASATVTRSSARAYLSRASGRAAFDLVLLDPPFAIDALGDVLLRLREGPLLSPQALVYFEAPHISNFDASGFEIVKQSRAGETRFGILARSEDDRYHRAPAADMGTSA